MSVWGILQRSAALSAHQPAVVDGETRYDYAELGRRASALAHYLRERGIRPGDRISILDDNSHTFLETYFAAAGTGAILNPLNTRLHPQEVAAILNDAGCLWLLADPRFAPQVEEALAAARSVRGVLWLDDECAGDFGLTADHYESVTSGEHRILDPTPVKDDQVVQLYYTSGTTGRPKGVMLTQRNVTVHALAAIAELQLTGDDIWGHIAPMFHLADAWASFAITWVGGRHVMQRRFDPAGVLSTIEQERITITNLIPTMLNAMVHHPHARSADCRSLRLILSGGAPIAPALVERIIQTLGCDYAQTYGMTETSPYLTISLLKPHLRSLPPNEELRYKAKTGWSFLPVELEVVDESDQAVTPNDQDVGEIRVRGGTISPGYWHQPDETAIAIRDGWLYTGDLATVDDEGYVTIVDRKKDMIISGGENVYSTEVENVLFSHPQVREAAVFGVPDSQWGEAVTAAVVLREGTSTSEEEIVAHCRQHLAAFKVPKSIVFVGELPRTGSGKISKSVLREAYMSGRLTCEPPELR
ncbi:MAG: long-chain-fatty-acid--CoA ligase [Phycisphaerales bacterium]|nr:MAG: long-chain-fatty-acid--CoA ligase [Phycisphaerales bacterium]